MDTFGPYLKKLRKEKGLTLKQVEETAGVSNAYISQLERGLRNPPHPDILNKLAAVYDVPARDLMLAAGYIKQESKDDVERRQLEKAFNHAVTDPGYDYGTRLKGQKISPEIKRFVVEMYEKTTKRKILE